MPDVREAITRVQRQQAALKRQLELFYMFVFGVVFGVISALVASFSDNVVRGNISYPVWYTIALFALFTATLGVLLALYLRLRTEWKDLALVERNFEEMLQDGR